MEDYNYDENYVSMYEESEDRNIDTESEDVQKDFNNNLINSLKQEEVKTTIFNIFDSYYESNKTSLKNTREKEKKRPSDDELHNIPN